ncbi:5470_t:CDS:2 [Diversispora eburnea]|uniref:5470_t:CDS:1 n=1 Tax=Diversispora eburnea TaxID=1213867 RepID=A0A9N8VHX3_9GLOM|nr:5470_t:CDS:2 [Diversispora eburnea]
MTYLRHRLKFIHILKSAPQAIERCVDFLEPLDPSKQVIVDCPPTANNDVYVKRQTTNFLVVTHDYTATAALCAAGSARYKPLTSDDNITRLYPRTLAMKVGIITLKTQLIKIIPPLNKAVPIGTSFNTNSEFVTKLHNGNMKNLLMSATTNDKSSLHPYVRGSSISHASEIFESTFDFLITRSQSSWRNTKRLEWELWTQNFSILESIKYETDAYPNPI